MLIIDQPRPEHLAALALLIIEGPDYVFPPRHDSDRQLEIRLDHHTGTVTFYDHLGLPVPVSRIKKHEFWHMFNHLFLQMQLDNQPFYLNN